MDNERSQENSIAVVGLGYVGLPLALRAAQMGYHVIGVDKSRELLHTIGSRRSPIGPDPYIDETIGAVELFLTDFPKPARIHIVCVPTPVRNKNIPDLSFVESATREIAGVLRTDDLVIIESTVYPGVCEDIVAPILDTSGVKYGLAHCPERINPGDDAWYIGNIPRVVGANTQEALQKAVQFYRSVVDAEIVGLSQLRAAEATKILENTFRDVNIAFVNEMARSFHLLGIDISEVIRGASTKPFGFMPHYPGVGVGGHCIAVDPYYMIEKGKEVGFDHEFLSLSRQINSRMPRFTMDLIQEGLNEIERSVKGAKIVVLGLSYKPKVADTRESPALELIELLRQKKAEVVRYDPYLPQLSDASSMAAALNGADCAVLATAHAEFLTDIERYRSVPVIIDGRNVLPKEEIRRLGVLYYGIGINIDT